MQIPRCARTSLTDCDNPKRAVVKGCVFKVLNSLLHSDFLLLTCSCLLLHEPAGVFPCSPADGHAINLDGWDAHAHRHGLAILAAGANAFIEL